MFVPGWGATAGMYRRGLPAGWRVLELPTFGAAAGELDRYRADVVGELARAPTPVAVAGHSMGAALAVLAAAECPDRIARLILLTPSGLPLDKPLRASAVTFAGQVARRHYPVRALALAVARVVLAPVSALRLARHVHDLDLRDELGRVRAQGIPSIVVACSTDRLATPQHCRRFAELLGAELQVVDDPGGHVWPITNPALLASFLQERAPAGGSCAGAAFGARACEASGGRPVPG
jgi:pimeloyl-ACP methyl ester carboxylesterase